MNWEVTHSNIAYQNSIFSVVTDQCKMPSGKVVQAYYRICIDDWCNMMVVTHQEQVVMVKQYRHAAQYISLELPGGLLNQNEDPICCAQREVLEETGYQVAHCSLLYKTFVNPALQNNRAYFFLGTQAVLKSKQQLDLYEDIEVVHLSKEKLLYILYHETYRLHAMQIGAIFVACKQLQWI